MVIVISLFTAGTWSVQEQRQAKDREANRERQRAYDIILCFFHSSCTNSTFMILVIPFDSERNYPVLFFFFFWS